MDRPFSPQSATAADALLPDLPAREPRNAILAVPPGAAGCGMPEAVDAAAELQRMIVEAVDFAIRGVFPTKYYSLCHAYAIVGSLVAGIALGREYRPVAGIAVIDCGSGHFLRFTDTTAFSTDIGGAYHCWIESHPADAHDKELVDIAFLHNSAYAKAHHLVWEKEESTYLWGRYSEMVLDGELETLPESFPDGKVWFREIPAGADWLRAHMHERQAEYVRLAGFALKKLHQDHAQRYPLGDRAAS